jgi:hypothetical protein
MELQAQAQSECELVFGQPLSVFGNVKIGPNGTSSPFTQADCQGGTAVINPGPWDPNRTTFDTTLYMSKILALMPLPNYFLGGDGLNTAQARYLRGRTGSTTARPL